MFTISSEKPEARPSDGLCGSDLHILPARRWLGEFFAVFEHRLDMEFDGLADERENLVFRLPGGDASGKVGDVSPKTFGSSLDHDQKPHRLALPNHPAKKAIRPITKNQ